MKKSESPTGFEPMTSQTPGGRSIHLSYGELLASEAIYLVDTETRKGLKRVTFMCLLCPMLVIIHFRKHHIWNEKKR